MPTWIPDTRKIFLVWKQFPQVMALVLLITSIIIAEFHERIPEYSREWLIKSLFTSVILVPIWIGIQLRSRFSVKKNLPATILLYIFSGIWAALVFNRVTLITSLADDLFIWIMALSAHALAVILPLSNLYNNSMDDFWQLNKVMFLRFLQSIFYSLFLSTGLVIAILALEHLLGFTVNERLYPDVFILIGILFNTWFFLAGIPQKWKSENNVDAYPNALRIFVQFVLLPLITVYMVILYIYVGKILILQQWPLTWVAYLILSFSIAGILAVLLIWPLRNSPQYPWIRSFSNWYFIALIPLSILLLFSIGKQIMVFGITPNRYLLASLSLWLPLISIFSFVSRVKNILIFPASLFILCCIAAPLPYFNAFDVSIRNQKGKLDTLLSAYNLIHPDLKLLHTTQIPDSVASELHSGFEFIHKWGYYDILKTYLPNNVVDSALLICKADTVRYTNYYPCDAEIINLIHSRLPVMHAEFTSPVESQFKQIFAERQPRKLIGFHTMIALNPIDPNAEDAPSSKAQMMQVQMNAMHTSVEFVRNGSVLHTHNLKADIQKWASLSSVAPDSVLSFAGYFDKIQYRCYLNQVDLEQSEDSTWIVNYWVGDCFWGDTPSK